jgi:hypothetical protein
LVVLGDVVVRHPQPALGDVEEDVYGGRRFTARALARGREREDVEAFWASGAAAPLPGDTLESVKILDELEHMTLEPSLLTQSSTSWRTSMNNPSHSARFGELGALVTISCSVEG